MTDINLEMRDVVKRHGDVVALDGVSLQIRRGEFFSLLGPSGSGKTTMLRLLAGFDTPDQGEIFIEGRSMNGIPPNRRPVNIVFQSYALFPHLTVARNVSFGLEMSGVSRSEIHGRVGAALDMVRLASKAERHPAQLSGGEQQRVALARALINRPAVLLLDEPLAALDQQLRLDMQIELKTIQEQVGITFLCVTHHQGEALTMSDRLAVMDQGRILQVGAPRDIYEKPETLFVANFIGDSNRLAGTIASVDGRRSSIKIDSLPASLLIQAPTPPGARVGTKVTLVLRPERIHLSPDVRADEFGNVLPARVTKTVYNGRELHYHLHVAQDVLWQASIMNSEERKPFAPGDSLYVRWNVDDAVILAE